MLAPVFLAPVLAEAARQRVSVHTLTRGLQITAEDLNSPGTAISHSEALTVVRRAVQDLRIDDAGLALGMRACVTERGILALGMLAAATLGDAIKLALRFPESAGCLLSLWETPSAQGPQLHAEPFPDDLDLQDFLVDLTFSSMVAVCRQVTAANYTPAGVELVRKAPAAGHAHEQFFGCPVRFGCPRNTLTTGADWHNFPLPWANRQAYRVSSQSLEQACAQWRAMTGLAPLVTRALHRSLPRIANLAEVAATLHRSERTLRRQLAQHGLSYRSLLDDSRKSRALELMTSKRWGLAQIAAEAGFSDTRAFTRAFKRWTGHSPTALRDRPAAPTTPAAEAEAGTD